MPIGTRDRATGSNVADLGVGHVDGLSTGFKDEIRVAHVSPTHESASAADKDG